MGLRGKFIFSLIIFLIIFGLRFLCSNCQEINKDLIQSSGSGPLDNKRRQQHQLWQAVGSHLTVQDDSKRFEDKFSGDNNEGSIPSVVRRRPGNGSGRKRKRRPQAYSTERIDPDNQNLWRGQVHDEPTREDHHFDSPTVTSTNSPSRIRTKQQYSTISAPTKFLEKIREPLAALEKEQKLYEIRDKQRKEFVPLPVHDKSYRKPYSQAKKEESTVTESTGDQHRSGAIGAANLKNILKTSGGLSLSEILQQKNLSLDDLLKGKHNALQAIQTTASTKCSNENCKSDELTTKYMKPARRIPSGYFQTTTIKPQNIQSDEKKTTLQSNRPINNKKRNQIRNEITSKTTIETESTNDFNNEKTPNIIELATIATLRDNPPLRKNIIYPSRPKVRNYSTTERSKDIESTTRKTKTTTKTEEPTTVTTAIPAYRRRASFRPKIKLPNLQKPIKNESSSSISSSASSESNSNEYHRNSNNNRRNNSKEKEEFSFSYDSHEDLSDTSNNFTNFYPSASSFNLLPTTTIKINQESVEEKLKQTNPEENFVDNFDDIDDLSNEHVATLEELFADTSLKSETTSKNHIQVITPRIDRKKQSSKANTTNNNNNFQMNNEIQNISSSYSPEITEINSPSSLDFTSDQSIDDRTELLELIEDRRSGNRLFKVLAQRNMTLDELIEHRKRGSSQIHLSEMLQQKSSQLFPSTSNLQDNLDIVTAFENFPHFNLIDLKSVQPDDIKTDSQGSSYFTSIIDIEPTDEIYKEGRSLKGKPIMQAQKQLLTETQEKLTKPLNFFPSWKSLSLASYAAANENNFLENHNSGHHITSPNNVDLLEPTIIKIEDDVARAHDILDLELSGHGFKRNEINDGNIESIHIPAGIQSAIIASSAIVAVSLIIFLFIFITCRWRQKRRKKLSYIEHYNAMKSKFPAIISQQSEKKSFNNNNNKDNHNYNESIYDSSNNGAGDCSSGYSQQSKNCSHISTIMFNGGRLSTMDPNSPEVHEYLYDAMRKPFRN